MLEHLEAIRSKLPKLADTLTPAFIAAIFAVSRSLAEMPIINSRWSDGGIVMSHDVHVGVEVNTGRGRRVPVIPYTDRLTLFELADAMNHAIRDGDGGQADAPRGTFTVGDGGAAGSVLSRPVLHDGQAGIYHFGLVRRVPSVVGDAITVRSVCDASFAFDHRVMDGATSARFQNLVKSRLETFEVDSEGRVHATA